MKKKMKREKGITLIALVITIIVLLILAAVSIATLTGENGILTKVSDAEEETRGASVQEARDLWKINQEADRQTASTTAQTLEELINDLVNQKLLTEDEKDQILGNESKGIEATGEVTIGSRTIVFGTVEPTPTVTEAIKKGTELSTTDNITVIDEYGNSITVPAGFKIVCDQTTNYASTVDKGIVVEDVNNGNQFVWIPVGTVYTNVEKTEYKTIELNRYTFNTTTGEPMPKGDAAINSNCQELSTSSYGNATAKNISKFKESVENRNGYYIGRYEARTATARSAKTNPLTPMTSKGTDYVYNYVTQLQAAERCETMYGEDKPFTSDLINSYAWDTAIVFEQAFDDRTDKTKPYSRQDSLNTGSLAETGTTIDKICNIYDMASNCLEWTTESYDSSQPCVGRGGNRTSSNYYTSARYPNKTSNANSDYSFRPVLYV